MAPKGKGKKKAKAKAEGAREEEGEGGEEALKTRKRKANCPPRKAPVRGADVGWREVLSCEKGGPKVLRQPGERPAARRLEGEG